MGTEHYTKSFEFFTDTGEKEQIVDVFSESPDQLLIGLSGSIRQLLGGIINPTGVKRLSRFGTTTPIVAHSGYIVFGDGKDINRASYSDEAKDYVSENLNEEINKFKDFKGFTTLVELFQNHQILLFHEDGADWALLLTLGKGRGIIGFSRVHFGFKCGIEKADEDKIRLISEKGKTFTMDFSADENVEHVDYDGSKVKGWVAGLPIIFTSNEISTVFSRNNVLGLGLSLFGCPEFRVEILNRKGEVVSKKNYAEKRQLVADPTTDFSGFAVVTSLPANGEEAPKVRLVFESGKFVSVSSMIVDTGDM